MDQVKTTLESNKIHCKKVKGNVFTRNKAISAFKVDRRIDIHL